MSETLHPGSGYAIIAEFIYPSSTNHSHVEDVKQYNLNQGEGVAFTGNNDNPGEVFLFQQSELSTILKNIPPGQLQMMALVDMTTGGLLITDGTPKGSLGLNADTALEPKVLTAELGRLRFAAIWGENEAKANAVLLQLKQERIKMN